MTLKLSEELYFEYEPNSHNEESTMYEVTTEEALQEVARLAMRRTGHIHFASTEEFETATGMERLTDDCFSGRPIGAVADAENNSVFFVAL